MISTIRSSAALLVLALAACTQTVRHVPVPLPLPARPVLPAVKPADLQCLAKPVYTAIVNRERGYKHWGLELEAIIKANNVKAAATGPFKNDASQ